MIRGHVLREFKVLDGGSGELYKLKNTAVLIYWPHGFGDWVFLSYIASLFESSNQYFITRYGNHTTALMDGCCKLTPVAIGPMVATDGDPSDIGQRHFGLGSGSATIDGTQILRIPRALSCFADHHKIEGIITFPFHEVYGHSAFPFHTKARNVLRSVADIERSSTALANPLKSALHFEAPGWVDRWVDGRLRNEAGWDGRRLCLVARNGYTSVGKNWGHRWREEMPAGSGREGEEARDFMRLMLQHDPSWLFLTFEDQLFHGDDTIRSKELNCVSYAELFGSADSAVIPFGFIIKALAKRATLAVGVPTGPYHFCMARPDLPTIGIWLEHLPCWYDEPKSISRHLIGSYLRETGALSRIGSALQGPGFSFESRHLETRIVPGEAVFESARELLGF